MRVLQYFARFFAWYLYRTNHTPAEIAPYNAIKTQFGLIRKSLRLGKAVEHFKAAAQAYDAKPSALDPFLRVCAVGRQLGYAGYMTNDNVHFLHASGIRKFEGKGVAQKWQERAYKSWFIGLSFNVVAGVYQLYRLRERERGVDKKEAESVVESKRIQRERVAVELQLVSDVCDLTVPSFGLGWAPWLDDGLVGLAGTVSSLIGVWSVWKKTA